MNVEIGRIYGEMGRFLIKGKTFVHKTCKHPPGVRSLQQGAVGTAGNALVQSIHIRMKPDHEPQFLQQFPVLRADGDAAAVEMMRLCLLPDGIWRRTPVSRSRKWDSRES